MADTATATPEAPAAAPATTPQPASPQGAPPAGASVTPIRQPHHSAQQPRTEAGQFAGPPGEKPAAQAPKEWRLGDRVAKDPDELYALAAERDVDYRALDEAQKELARLRAEADRWKDPSRALTPEQQDAIAYARLQEYLAQEEEKKLPPEAQQARRELREAQRLRAELQAQKDEADRQRAAAQDLEARQAAVAEVRAVLAAWGAEERPENVREVLHEMRAAVASGRQYPPEVIARRVQARLERESMARVVKMGPQRLLAMPELLAALNAVEDPALLDALSPLTERARLRAMAKLGGGQPVPAAPAATPTPVLQPGQEPRTTNEWVAYFRSGGTAETPMQIQRRNDLKDRGLL